MSKYHEAGKGDRNRSNNKAYRTGYDRIKWGKKPKAAQSASPTRKEPR